MFSKNNDKLIDDMLEMFRRDLQHFADLDIPESATESVRRQMLADEAVGVVRDYAKYLHPRSKGL